MHVYFHKNHRADVVITVGVFLVAVASADPLCRKEQKYDNIDDIPQSCAHDK